MDDRGLLNFRHAEMFCTRFWPYRKLKTRQNTDLKNLSKIQDNFLYVVSDAKKNYF